MFDYTRTAIKKIGDDFKKVGFLLGLSGQIFYLFYIVYSIITSRGILWANYSLGAVSLLYLIFYIFTFSKSDKKDRVTKNKVRRLQSILKLFVKGLVLAMMFYSVYYTVVEISLLSVVFTALSIVSFILQIALELVRCIIENRYELLMTGWEADMEKIKKPFETAKNILTFNFKKEEPKEPSKFKIVLDKKIEKEKNKRKNNED